MKKILFSLVVLSFLIGGYTVLAQDNNLPSPGITPDSPLYFLKTWKETIQNFFTFGAENKAKQFLHLADVRLAEYQKMIDKGKTEIAQKTLEKYEKQLNHALQKIEELKNKGKDIKDVSQKLENTVGKHIEVLEKNLEKAPEAAKEGLENAIENSSKVIKKIEGKDKKEKSCIDSRGTVSTSLCCKEVSDFPDLCFIGACGCSSGDSHEIKICDCGPDKCFDGEECVVKEAAEDETADWKIYRNEDYGFEIDYPKDWQLFESGRGGDIVNIVIFVPPGDITKVWTRFGVSIEEFEEIISLEAFTAFYLSEIGEDSVRKGIDWSGIETKDTTLAGQPAYQIISPVFQYSAKPYPNWKFKYVWTVYNNKAHILTFSAPEEDFNNYSQLIEEMINSFKFTD